MKFRALLLCLLTTAFLARSAHADYWTMAILKPGLRVNVLMSTRVDAVYFDHDSIPPYKDSHGKLIKPYGISIDLKRDPSKDIEINKLIANGFAQGELELELWKDPAKPGAQPSLDKAIWVYGVSCKRTQELGDPKGGTESLFITFVQANWVRNGKTYQTDTFGNFTKDHRTPPPAPQPAAPKELTGPPAPQTDYWSFAILKPGLKVNVLMSTRVDAVYFDHDSIPPYKDSHGKLIKPYGISIDLKRDPSKDIEINKLVANGFGTGEVQLQLWKAPKKQGAQPDLDKTIWIYGVRCKKTQELGDPKGGTESLFITFVQANWVRNGKTYQTDTFGNFTQDHRKP